MTMEGSVLLNVSGVYILLNQCMIKTLSYLKDKCAQISMIYGSAMLFAVYNDFILSL